MILHLLIFAAHATKISTKESEMCICAGTIECLCIAAGAAWLIKRRREEMSDDERQEVKSELAKLQKDS